MDCLLRSLILPFPTVGTRVHSQWRPKKNLSFAVYCICRLPDGDPKFECFPLVLQVFQNLNSFTNTLLLLRVKHRNASFSNISHEF
jgi:hypothetical protein